MIQERNIKGIKISRLDEALEIRKNDYFPIVQDGITKKVKGDKLVVDLSNYYTKEEVDSEIDKVKLLTTGVKFDLLETDFIATRSITLYKAILNHNLNLPLEGFSVSFYDIDKNNVSLDYKIIDNNSIEIQSDLPVRLIIAIKQAIQVQSHNHDEDYSKLNHKHDMSDIENLVIPECDFDPSLDIITGLIDEFGDKGLNLSYTCSHIQLKDKNQIHFFDDHKHYYFDILNLKWEKCIDISYNLLNAQIVRYNDTLYFIGSTLNSGKIVTYDIVSDIWDSTSIANDELLKALLPSVATIDDNIYIIGKLPNIDEGNSVVKYNITTNTFSNKGIILGYSSCWTNSFLIEHKQQLFFIFEERESSGEYLRLKQLNLETLVLETKFEIRNKEYCPGEDAATYYLDENILYLYFPRQKDLLLIDLNTFTLKKEVKINRSNSYLQIGSACMVKDGVFYFISKSEDSPSFNKTGFAFNFSDEITELQLNRSSNNILENYVGKNGQPIFNVQTKRLHFMDGVTKGGTIIPNMDDLNGLGGGDNTVYIETFEQFKEEVQKGSVVFNIKPYSTINITEKIVIPNLVRINGNFATFDFDKDLLYGIEAIVTGTQGVLVDLNITSTSSSGSQYTDNSFYDSYDLLNLFKHCIYLKIKTDNCIPIINNCKCDSIYGKSAIVIDANRNSIVSACNCSFYNAGLTLIRAPRNTIKDLDFSRSFIYIYDHRELIIDSTTIKDSEVILSAAHNSTISNCRINFSTIYCCDGDSEATGTIIKDCTTFYSKAIIGSTNQSKNTGGIRIDNIIDFQSNFIVYVNGFKMYKSKYKFLQVGEITNANYKSEASVIVSNSEYVHVWTLGNIQYISFKNCKSAYFKDDNNYSTLNNDNLRIEDSYCEVSTLKTDDIAISNSTVALYKNLPSKNLSIKDSVILGYYGIYDLQPSKSLRIINSKVFNLRINSGLYTEVLLENISLPMANLNRTIIGSSLYSEIKNINEYCIDSYSTTNKSLLNISKDTNQKLSGVANSRIKIKSFNGKTIKNLLDGNIIESTYTITTKDGEEFYRFSHNGQPFVMARFNSHYKNLDVAIKATIGGIQVFADTRMTNFGFFLCGYSSLGVRLWRIPMTYYEAVYPSTFITNPQTASTCFNNFIHNSYNVSNTELSYVELEYADSHKMAGVIYIRKKDFILTNSHVDIEGTSIINYVWDEYYDTLPRNSESNIIFTSYDTERKNTNTMTLQTGLTNGLKSTINNNEIIADSLKLDEITGNYKLTQRISDDNLSTVLETPIETTVTSIYNNNKVDFRTPLPNDDVPLDKNNYAYFSASTNLNDFKYEYNSKNPSY